MTNQYRAIHPSYRALYGEDVFEADYTADEERDWLDRHLLELAPRPYRVLSDNYTIDGRPVEQGSVFEAGLSVDIEAMLISGGHIERTRRDAKPTVEAPPEVEAVTEPAPEPTPRKKASK